VQVGEVKSRRREGKVIIRPVYDYRGVSFHSFRRACGSFLLHHGKSSKQVQGWLRHAQHTTTMNLYVEQVDAGLGGAHVWEEIVPRWGQDGAKGHPETAENGAPPEGAQTVSQSQIREEQDAAAA
jgi:hypothetical protein